MALDEVIDRIEATGKARVVLRAHRGTGGLCDAYFDRLLTLYADDPPRAARLAGHWRAFLDLGDDPALAYRAKGAADRFGGRWLASAQAFVRAGELAQDERSRLSYPLGAIDGLAKAGRIDEAVAMGERLAGELDALGETVPAARARLNTANALMWADRPDARRFYRMAIPVFRKSGMAVEEASAHLGLSTTHLYCGDPAIAAAEAREGGAVAQEAGLEYLDTLCQMNVACAALVQGRADEALAALLVLRPRLEGNPSELARADLAIGDACLRLNLFSEAREAYAAALAEREALGATDRAYVLFGLGEAKAPSDPDAADRHLGQAAARWRTLGNLPWMSAALAARGALRPGAPTALRHASRALAAAVGSPYHETLAHLAHAEALVTRGRDPETSLRTASRLARRYGFRRFAWRIHALRARASKTPLRHHRRMLEEILRERLAVTSVAARTGFLKDKSDALGAYLTHLLTHPTSRRVAEAREAIRQTRAATLLDEILSSGSLRLDPKQARRLEELRAQVTFDAQQEAVPDARAAFVPHPQRREWTEATHLLGALDAVVPPAVAEGCVVFAETGSGIWAMVDNRAIHLPITTAKLEESLRWLRLELQAPTADRDAPAAEALELLEELRNDLVLPWLDIAGGRSLRICPDGLLWRVPWDALVEGPASVNLLLHPSFAGGRAVGALERVAVWINAAPDLPNAAAEEATLRERFPNATMLRSRKEIVESMSEPWDLVHVVGHARHNAGNPMFSALEFSDGPLYASEIARSGLRARLACLSACETGMLSLDTREEPDGLVRAFLARGAEAVLASLWPLDDAAASRFFASLYGGLTPEMDLSEAVCAARQSVREWREHPYFWASLSLFGGYQS